MGREVCLFEFCLLDLVTQLDEVLHHLFENRLSFECEHLREVRDALEVSDVAC